jgi:Asp-tRNA(Asn)/Glu-tRNA(Gln) amidotransferase A subunit family amidase
VISVIPGPIGRCVEDCALYFEAIAQPATWHADPYIYPLSFNRAVYEEVAKKTGLRIGYYYKDGVSCYAQVTKTMIYEVRDRLLARGHTLVKIRIPNMMGVSRNFLKLLAADGGRRVPELLRGEEPVWSTWGYKALYTLRYVRRPLLWLVGKIGWKTEASIGSAAEEKGGI